MFEVDENVFEEMLKRYERTRKSINEDVMVLKEWMKTQPHLPEIMAKFYFIDGNNNIKLINFLLLNKCSIEKAKQKIDNYYTIKSVVPDMFENLNPRHPKFELSRKISYIVPFSNLTKEHYRVILYKQRTYDVSQYDALAAVQRGYHIEEIRLFEDRMFGDIIISDVEGMKLVHLVKFIQVLNKTFFIYEKVFSIPLKAVYVINCVPYLDTALDVCKKIMKPKLFQRIHLCDDHRILHRVFQKEVIPKDYGGTGKSLQELQDMLNEKIKEYQQYFDKIDNLKVDESLRPEELRNDELLGFYGNFKKLDVD